MEEQANKQARETADKSVAPELPASPGAQHKNPLRQIGFVNRHNGHINIGQAGRQAGRQSGYTAARSRYPAGSTSQNDGAVQQLKFVFLLFFFYFCFLLQQEFLLQQQGDRQSEWPLHQMEAQCAKLFLSKYSTYTARNSNKLYFSFCFFASRN